MGKSKTKRRDAAAPVVPYVGGFPTRSLEQITADAIAWQESGFSTDGLALPPVFAVVRLIASTIDQLPVTVDGAPPPEWLRSPRRYGSALDLGDLIQWCVTSMALHGAAYVRCERVGESWRVDALHPGSVQTVASAGGIVSLRHIVDSVETPPVPPRAADWREGRAYVLHIPYLVTPQYPAGISPIRVARESVLGYFAVERQASKLLDGGTHSGGRLETEQDITPATAIRYQDTWVGNRRTGKLPVLGAGLKYVNDVINPSDAQWLESRQFNAQQIAMMFGIPPDYLGMTASGGSSSLSYSNSQDNDKRFRRNCLEAFTSQLEDALSLLTPPGRNADEARTVRFDYDAWEASGADDGSSGDDPGPDPGPGREPDVRGARGPVRDTDPVRRTDGELRPGQLRPGAGDGDAAAVGASEGRAGGSRDGSPEHPRGADGHGRGATDCPGPRRDDAAPLRFLAGLVRWVRPGPREGIRDERRIPVLRDARTELDPAARVFRRGGTGNTTPGGTDRARDDD